jgi:hypothetical protein
VMVADAITTLHIQRNLVTAGQDGKQIGRLFGRRDFALGFADPIVNCQKFGIQTKFKAWRARAMAPQTEVQRYVRFEITGRVACGWWRDGAIANGKAWPSTNLSGYAVNQELWQNCAGRGRAAETFLPVRSMLLACFARLAVPSIAMDSLNARTVPFPW